MAKCREPGIRLESDLFVSAPSTMARQLFYHVTRCGHYYCTPEYHFMDSCDTAKLPGHQTYAIHYICSGSMYEENGTDYAVALPGQVCILDCSRTHHYYARENTEYLWLHLCGSNVKDFFSYLYTRNGKTHCFTPPNSERTKATILEIIQAFRLPGQMNESELSQCIYRLLCDLVVMPQNAIISSEITALSTVMNYISMHLFEDLTVSSMAASVHLSPSHFSRLFKQQTGHSPHDYITLCRIDAAKELLRTTSLPIKDIAKRVGYHSEANFITSFSGKTGLTPAVFRRNLF